METYTYVRPRGRVITVYDKEMADKLGIRYQPWREWEPDNGGWVETDNGYIVEAHKRSPAIVQTYIGTQLSKRNFRNLRFDPKFDYGKPGFNYLLILPTDRDWSEAKYRKARTTIKAFVILLKQYKDTSLAFHAAYKMGFGFGKDPFCGYNHLMRNPWFREELMTEMIRVFDINDADFRQLIKAQWSNIIKNDKNPKQFEALKYVTDIFEKYADRTVAAGQNNNNPALMGGSNAGGMVEHMVRTQEIPATVTLDPEYAEKLKDLDNGHEASGKSK